jgi:spore coat protein CotH
MPDFDARETPDESEVFGRGSNDTKLKYTDDDADSYSSIFESAKTDVTKADQKRLIEALKKLSEGTEDGDCEKIENAVNIEEVMRYMTVHNFLVNEDSYTGSMVHNYYLYEENGLLSMIPWDYNLAFGTFKGQDATASVNDAIDTPLSISENDTDRPMFSWITSTEEYTELYHGYFEEFIEKFYSNGYLDKLIDTTYEMIKDYVDKDPTKFCTTEEFDKAVTTLKKFVNLRFESIKAQVNGTIASSDEDRYDSSELIDASDITVSDMGTMDGDFGRDGGFKMPDRNDFDGKEKKRP